MKSILIKLWKDESGQGTAEYVLILVGVVAAAILFRKKLVGEDGDEGLLGRAMKNVSDKIGKFTSG